MAYLRFFSVLLHPLKPIAIKKCNISDQVSLQNNALFSFLIHNDLMMMMAIQMCNLHDKVRTCYSSKGGSKNQENTDNVCGNNT